MAKNEYDISGHITVPYNSETKQLFMRTEKHTDYRLYKDDVLLAKRVQFSKQFMNTYLKDKGFRYEKVHTESSIPRKVVDGIRISITRIKKEGKTIELLVAVHAKDMRSLINKCDELVEVIGNRTNIKITDEAKLWTRQEVC